MNDDVKAAIEWARGAVESHDLYRGARDERDGSVENMRALLAHIDGEPARIAAAVADADARQLLRMADEIAALRARVAELERQREGMLMGGVTVEARQQLERAEKAEVERDALKLEVESLARDMVAMTVTANAEVAAGLAIAAERDALRAWVSAVSEALGAIEPVSDCRVELSADAAAA